MNCKSNPTHLMHVSFLFTKKLNKSHFVCLQLHNLSTTVHDLSTHMTKPFNEITQKQIYRLQLHNFLKVVMQTTQKQISLKLRCLLEMIFCHDIHKVTKRTRFKFWIVETQKKFSQKKVYTWYQRHKAIIGTNTTNTCHATCDMTAMIPRSCMIVKAYVPIWYGILVSTSL
jgi:hypothetical protein